MESLEVRKEYMIWHWEPSTAYPKLRAPENPLFSKFTVRTGFHSRGAAEENEEGRPGALKCGNNAGENVRTTV